MIFQTDRSCRLSIDGLLYLISKCVSDKKKGFYSKTLTGVAGSAHTEYRIFQGSLAPMFVEIISICGFFYLLFINYLERGPVSVMTTVTGRGQQRRAAGGAS